MVLDEIDSCITVTVVRASAEATPSFYYQTLIDFMLVITSSESAWWTERRRTVNRPQILICHSCSQIYGVIPVKSLILIIGKDDVKPELLVRLL